VTGPSVERGAVTAINAEGFGFIAPDAHAGEIWIRPRSVRDAGSLREGQRVQYVIAFGSLGIEAANVQPLDTSS
jgi:cold shock CspA family protein